MSKSQTATSPPRKIKPSGTDTLRDVKYYRDLCTKESLKKYDPAMQPPWRSGYKYFRVRIASSSPVRLFFTLTGFLFIDGSLMGLEGKLG